MFVCFELQKNLYKKRRFFNIDQKFQMAPKLIYDREISKSLTFCSFYKFITKKGQHIVQ